MTEITDSERNIFRIVLRDFDAAAGHIEATFPHHTAEDQAIDLFVIQYLTSSADSIRKYLASDGAA